MVMKRARQQQKQGKDLWCKPMLSRYSREPLPSQMPTPFCFSTLALVLPLMNQSNSSATPAHQTSLCTTAEMPEGVIASQNTRAT